MNALCKYIVLFLFLTAFAEASSQYRDTVYVEQYGDSSSIFIFRGCRENVVRTPGYVPSNETQGQLLAHVYGSEPLKDSTEIYRDWATSCDMVKADRNVAWPIVVLGALYGVPATYFGAHLFSRDYDYKVTKGLGYVGGGIWFVTGVAAILAGAIAIVPAIMTLFDESGEKAIEYRDKSKKWELRVTPTVKLDEPGGGMLLQVGF